MLINRDICYNPLLNAAGSGECDMRLRNELPTDDTQSYYEYKYARPISQS